MADSYKKNPEHGISAIVVPCSARKEKLPCKALQADQLGRMGQASLAAAWGRRLSAAGPSGRLPGVEIYAGRSFKRARGAADSVKAPLFILSAGLGLVSGSTKVPAYDLTLSPSAPTTIQTLITDVFDPGAWWESLQSGPFASPMARLGDGQGRILIALSQPYAKLVGRALAELPASTRERIRLLGTGLEPYLPETLHPQVVHYDSRLDALMPGTRLDFASRTLAHFVGLVSELPITTVAADQERVHSTLVSVAFPASITRSRLTDAALRKHIRPMVRLGWSASAALKHLRAELQVACEERRFRRLYEEVSA